VISTPTGDNNRDSTPLNGPEAERFLKATEGLARRLAQELIPWAGASDMEPEDVLLEVKLAFLLARARYHPDNAQGASLSTFLWAYARQYVLHRIRERSNLLGMPENAPGRLTRRVLLTGELAPDPAPCFGEEPGFAKAELQGLLAAFPEPDKTILEMLAEGVEKAGIARQFGHSSQWVAHRLRQVRIRLKRLGWP